IHAVVFSEEGTFSLSQENQWIKVNYPTGTTYQIVLRLEKEGYQVWEEDISGSSFKETFDSNIIELKKALTRIAFSIENGSGANLKIDDGELSKDADADGNVWFDIDPFKAMGFTITKEGFKEYHGTFTPDQVLYEITLEPITQPKIVTNIPISNEAYYNGQVILTDNLGNIYKIPITQPEIQVQIKGNQIISARLEPESLPGNGKTYRIDINRAGTKCKIIPIEERMLAIVVFITNSRYALKKQDEIDQAISLVFSLKSNYKDLYVGWVDYNKTSFQLKEFKNSKGQQINISDVNNNDTADVSLNKIIDYIKRKFTSGNANKGQKSTFGRLAVILDKSAAYLDRLDYSTQDLKVQLIDINDVINSPNLLLNLINED
ncbi:MAG: hypothetical protein MUF15_28050, partial [Acidobacteria bacterium]|nr:hypothetical protein [Acidobacteriota bacterium]